MEKQKRNNEEYYTIDLMHIVKSLWQRVWLIIMAGVVAAAVGFGVSTFAIAPTYSSSIMLYVNNSSFSLGNTSFSISASEITAAQSLVNTYGEILNNRTTLERVAEKADVPYSAGQLSGMITSLPSNETEIMKVTVTAENPYEAARIANCIAEVLPIRISEIIDGASMEVVDYATVNRVKIGPSITKYTVAGLMTGVVLAVVVLVIAAMLDDTIHDEEYILKTYNYSILAKVPDLLNTGTKQYSYYYQNKPKAKN